jgi:putative ABC transport system substrate-binding protein
MFFPTELIINNGKRIAAWSLKNRIPTISGWSQFTEAGNLVTYGPNLRRAMRRLAFYADRVIRGAKPADLPVELPTEVELAINMKTAKALDMTIPRSILVRADRMID